jgi:hypothetical protein
MLNMKRISTFVLIVAISSATGYCQSRAEIDDAAKQKSSLQDYSSLRSHPDLDVRLLANEWDELQSLTMNREWKANAGGYRLTASLARIDEGNKSVVLKTKDKQLTVSISKLCSRDREVIGRIATLRRQIDDLMQAGAGEKKRFLMRPDVSTKLLAFSRW